MAIYELDDVRSIAVDQANLLVGDALHPASPLKHVGVYVKIQTTVYEWLEEP